MIRYRRRKRINRSYPQHRRSTNSEWGTPKPLFKALDRTFHFTLDACATPQNSKCRRYFTKKEDGLQQNWSKDEVIWLNPPYGGEIERWLKKAAESQATVVALIPSRTGNGWWFKYVTQANLIVFIRGRIRFEGGKNLAPFDSAIAIFRPRRGILREGIRDFNALSSRFFPPSVTMSLNHPKFAKNATYAS
jgi:site-specific DNA-methyltransferase (adenine-specific)